MKSHMAVPDALEHGISGWPPRGPNGFKWLGDRLRFMDPSLEAERLVVPDDVEWAAFWDACEQFDAWNLPPQFGDFEVVDGRLMRTSLAIAGRSIRVIGQFAGAPEDVFKRAIRLHAAMQRLVRYEPEWLETFGVK